MKLSSFFFLLIRFTASTTLVFCAVFIPLQTVVAQNNSIQWQDMQEAQKMAEANGKKVLIYAEASWCVYCKKMDKKVFPDQAVIDSMETYFYPVRLDIESDKQILVNGQKMTQQQFARTHRVRATPTIFFMDKDGTILGSQPGFIPADTFSKLLAYVGSDSYKTTEFKNYLKNHSQSSSAQ